MATYISKNHRGVFTIDGVIGDALGKTYEDYLNGAWIELTKSQLEFLEENPAASHKEIIEKQLVPAPPQPSLEEIKEQAVNQMTNEAVSQLENLIPLSVVVEAIFGEMGQDEIEQLRQNYANAKMAIVDSFADASEIIKRAESYNDTQSAIDGFNESVRLTVDSGVIKDTVRDSLTVTDRIVDREVELPVREKLIN